MHKKFITFSVTFILVVAACQKKTLPVITSRTEFPDPPPKDVSKPIENSPEEIAIGKTIYEGKCSRCHDLREPSLYTAERWSSILQIMIPRARLTHDQAKHVTAYVMSNAKK